MLKLSKINEGLIGNMWGRAGGEKIRKEDGILLGKFEDDTKILMPPNCYDNGSLVKFDGNVFYHLEYLDTNIVCISDGDTDTFYRINDDSEPYKPNMVECFKSDVAMREDDFGSLKAYISSQNINYIEDLDHLEIEKRPNYYHFEDINLGDEFYIYYDEDTATNDAIEQEKELLEGSKITKEWIKRWHDHFDYDFLDEDSIKDELKDSAKTYYEELEEGDAIDELIRYKIIEETEEYFHLDENDDIDTIRAKFDYSDYTDDYVEAVMESYEGEYVENYILNFGTDGIEDYIDFEKLAELIVNADGRGSSISSYDGKEHMEYIDGKTYLIYRAN